MNGNNTGPWVVRSSTTRTQIEHAEGRHNAVLILSADFETGAQEQAFAQQLADTLNNSPAGLLEQRDMLLRVLRTALAHQSHGGIDHAPWAEGARTAIKEVTGERS